MHGQSGRFDEYEQVRVLVQDVEFGQGLGGPVRHRSGRAGFRAAGFVGRHAYELAQGQPVERLGALAVHPDLAGADETLQRGRGHIAPEPAGQILEELLAGLLGRDRERLNGYFHGQCLGFGGRRVFSHGPA